MRKISLFIGIISCFGLQAIDLKGESLSIGPGLFATGQYRVESKIDHHSSDAAFTTFPYVYYKNGRFEINGLEAKFKFQPANRLEIGPIIKYSGDFYEGPGIEERELSAFAGFFFNFDLLQISYLKGIHSDDTGSIGEVAVRDNFKITDSWYLNYSLGLEFFDDKYVDYYFGVKPSEAGLFPTYSGKSSLNTVVSIGSFIDLGHQVSLYLSLGHKFLGSEVSDSPTVDRENYFFGTSFIAYRFY